MPEFGQLRSDPTFFPKVACQFQERQTGSNRLQGRHQSGNGGCPKADIVKRAVIDHVWDFPLSQLRSAIHGIADIPRGAPIVIARISMWIASLALADLDDIVVCRRR